MKNIFKYYFVNEVTGRRHIVVAKDKEDVQNILRNDHVIPTNFYELKGDTFENSGFLITDSDK